MAQSTERSHDLADMILKVQQSASEPNPTNSNHFLAGLGTVSILSTGTPASTLGPPYYCEAIPAIVCGFWSAS